MLSLTAYQWLRTADVVLNYSKLNDIDPNKLWLQRESLIAHMTMYHSVVLNVGVYCLYTRGYAGTPPATTDSVFIEI